MRLRAVLAWMAVTAGACGLFAQSTAADAGRRGRAEGAMRRLMGKMGEALLYEADHPNRMIFATNVDRKTLDELKHVLTLYARIQWRDLFAHRFDDYVTVIVPRQWEEGSSHGYYSHNSRQVHCRSVGMVLMHEFTHALHHADQRARGQRHPTWVSEGLASLFESAEVCDRTLRVQPNHRALVIRELAASRKCIPWAEFFRLSRGQFMDQPRACYAQARHIMLYLHEAGLLRAWYETYVARFDSDPTGTTAVEMVLGKPLADAEADWKKWVVRLATPPVGLDERRACLGVTVQSVIDGLRIGSVMTDSAAEKAGLRAGDVIVKVNSRRVVEHLALLSRIAACRAGDELCVEVRRDGQYRDVQVVLQPLMSAAHRQTAAGREEAPTDQRPGRVDDAFSGRP